MDVPEVDKKMLSELESMGFPTVRATRALFYLGETANSNCNLEDAINWIIEHDHNPDMDQMPQVINIEIESVEPSLLPQELKIKAQELEMRVRKKKEEEKRMEREREKERIRVGKEVLETKKIDEENERKRMIEFRKAEKEEEKRARENILRKLEQDKAERRRKLGLPPDHLTAKSTTPVHEKKAQYNSSLSIKNTSDANSMTDCLRSLRKNYKDDDAKVGRAFQTLLIYVGNVVKNPDIEKFRKIRLSNPIFQTRVGSLKGGIEFLKLCGFEMLADNEFLFLPRDKVDIRLLNKAGTVLHSAMNNPYFGIL